MKQAKKIVNSNSGIELLRRLSADGKRVITLDDARSYGSEVGISELYLTQAFHYLEKAGWVTRLQHGLYAIQPPLINAPIHEFEIAMHLVSPAAISHWSAMSFHGLTEQIPRTIFVLTPDPAASRHRPAHGQEHQIQGHTYVFVQVKPERFFGTQTVWFGEARVEITDLERTLIDGLTRPAYCGGFGEVAEIFQETIDRIDVKKIIDYALKLDTATVRRLGWVMQQSGIELTDLEPLRSAIGGQGYRLLDPTGQHKGPCNNIWRIQENLTALI